MISLLDAITVVLVLLHNFHMIQLDACGEHIDLADNFQLMRNNSIRRKNHSDFVGATLCSKFQAASGICKSRSTGKYSHVIRTVRKFEPENAVRRIESDPNFV